MMCGHVLHLGLGHNLLCLMLRRVSELLFCAWVILVGVVPMLVREVLDWSAVLEVFLKNLKMLVWMVPSLDLSVSKSLLKGVLIVNLCFGLRELTVGSY